MTKHWLRSLALQLLPGFVLISIMMFTALKFFLIPYAGFEWTGNGVVSDIYVPSNTSLLKVGDQLRQVGQTRWDDYLNTSHLTLFDKAYAGQVVPVQVLREKQTLTIPWTFPGFTLSELMGRLISEWALPYMFWMAGTLTILFLRPKDARWGLFIAYNFLTAIWIAAGSSVTRNHLWIGLVTFKAAIWLCVPVYWHLHWVFPKPLGRFHARAWWGIYLVGAALALLEILQVIPRRAYYVGFGLAILGSLVLLLAHFITKPDQRRDILLLVIATFLAFLPSIALGIVSAFIPLPQGVVGAGLVALPLLPFAYLYSAYRKQLGDLELRANRAISLYTFFILLGSLWVFLILPLAAWLETPESSLLIGSVGALLIGLLTVFEFVPFQQLIERRLFGLKQTPTELIENYSTRINVSLDLPTLTRLLMEEITPHLFIRQSALLILGEKGFKPIYVHGLENEQLPTHRDLPRLLADSGKQRIFNPDELVACAWAKVVLTLSMSGKPTGLWLLGRRDPDDFYSQREIATLQSLANQTAIALTNIVQAERLRGLYQNNVDQREVERERLAHELHDNSLNELKLMLDSIDGTKLTPEFMNRYEKLTASLRQTISDLRPAMLNYGLQAALTGLVDDCVDRSGNTVKILLDLPQSEGFVQHDGQVVLHMYRIVQQTLENALRHAQANTIRLHGEIVTESIDLTVEDDGVGFDTRAVLDAAQPGAPKHFGLAGIFERAAIINAEIMLTSAPREGTKIRIIWKSNTR
jgi:signal transduction histidine kinase